MFQHFSFSYLFFFVGNVVLVELSICEGLSAGTSLPHEPLQVTQRILRNIPGSSEQRHSAEKRATDCDRFDLLFYLCGVRLRYVCLPLSLPTHHKMSRPFVSCWQSQPCVPISSSDDMQSTRQQLLVVHPHLVTTSCCRGACTQQHQDDAQTYPACKRSVHYWSCYAIAG